MGRYFPWADASSRPAASELSTIAIYSVEPAPFDYERLQLGLEVLFVGLSMATLRELIGEVGVLLENHPDEHASIANWGLNQSSSMSSTR